jgi:hypothetical protein
MCFASAALSALSFWFNVLSTILMYNLGLSDADRQLIASLFENSLAAKNET